MHDYVAGPGWTIAIEIKEVEFGASVGSVCKCFRVMTVL
jgi:hypothetical protein